MTSTILHRLCATFVLAASIAGCRGGVTEETPVVPIRNMYNQPRYDDQSHSDFFQDGRTMREPVFGTVAQEMPTQYEVETGRSDDNRSWVLEVPNEVVAKFHADLANNPTHAGLTPWERFTPEQQQEARLAMLERGQERFDIYCAPCHGVVGDGNGLIAQRVRWLSETLRDPGAASLNIISLQDERIRTMPDGQMYSVVTHGIRTMPAYSQSIQNQDRWAIVAYVRALQLSYETMPASARRDAEETN